MPCRSACAPPGGSRGTGSGPGLFQRWQDDRLGQRGPNGPVLGPRDGPGTAGVAERTGDQTPRLRPRRANAGRLGLGGATTHLAGHQPAARHGPATLDDPLDGESPSGLHESAFDAWVKGDMEKSEAAFRRALGRLDAAPVAGTAAGETGTRRVELRAALALLLRDLGRIDESDGLWRDAVEEARHLPRDAWRELVQNLAGQYRRLRECDRPAIAEKIMSLAACKGRRLVRIVPRCLS